jgi:two-component system chemotaxis response regulator CheB
MESRFPPRPNSTRRFRTAACGDNRSMDEPAPTVVVVGASAGGVEALTTLVRDLPQDLDAAVCVVLHLPAGAESRLAEILSRAGPLPATQARGGEVLERGRIVVAPPGCHLVIADGHAEVTRGPHENGLRPSIDVLFRSAAVAFGPRTVAVILSGSRDDGVAGASAIGARGGCVFVQDPDDALFGALPAHTVVRDHPDRVLPLAELAPAVAAAVERLSEEVSMSENRKDEMGLETDYATLDAEAIERDGPPGEPSAFSCPECGGVLWEVEDDGEGLLRFRCRVGHAYTAEGAVDEQAASVETALWTALRALHERAQLCERLAERMAASGAERSSDRFAEFAKEAREQGEVIRRLLAETNVPAA